MMVFSMILWMSVGHKLAHRRAVLPTCAAHLLGGGLFWQLKEGAGQP